VVDLLELVFLSLFILAGFGCLTVELLSCELEGWVSIKTMEVGCMKRSIDKSGGLALRLKSAFSRPDMMILVCERTLLNV
jgi:hypothetical protein